MDELLNQLDSLPEDQLKQYWDSLTEDERLELETLAAQRERPTIQMPPEKPSKYEGINTRVKNPDISAIDRMVVKNLSNDSSASINYLQKNYPDLEFTKVDNDIFARKRGSNNEYTALDPDFDIKDFSSYADIPQDIGDIAFNALQGVGEGVATTAGAVMGAPAGLPGILAGGMAGGAAAGAAGEALRQQLGKWAGIPQEINPEQVQTSALLGGLPVPLLGVGKAGAKGLGKSLANSPKLAGFVESGVISPMADAGESLVKMAGEKLAQISPEVLERAVKRPAMMEAIEAVGPKNYANDALRQTEEALVDQGRKIGQQIGELYAQEGKNIDISPVKSIITDEIERLETKQIKSGLAKEDQMLLEGLTKELENVFQVNKAQEVSPLTWSDIFADRKLSQKYKSELNTAMRSNEDIVNKVALIDGKPIFPDKPIEKFINEDSIPAPRFFDIKKDLGALDRRLKDKFAFDNPAYAKQISGIIGKASKKINDVAKEIIPESGELGKKYHDNLRMQKFLADSFRDKRKVSGMLEPEAFINKGDQKLTRASLPNTKNPDLDPRYQKMKQIAQETGIDLTDVGKDLKGYEFATNAGVHQFSRAGTTSTSKTNIINNISRAAGMSLAKSLGIPSSLGYAGGTIAGTMLASPLAFKNYMQSVGKLGNQGFNAQEAQFLMNLGINPWAIEQQAASEQK